MIRPLSFTIDKHNSYRTQ